MLLGGGMDEDALRRIRRWAAELAELPADGDPGVREAVSHSVASLQQLAEMAERWPEAAVVVPPRVEGCDLQARHHRGEGMVDRAAQGVVGLLVG